MNVKSLENTTSKLQVVITSKDGITKVVNLNELAEILASNGDKFQILKSINGENQIVDNFFVIKNNQSLELSFTNGQSLSITNFYSFDNVEISFESTDNSIYTVSSLSSFGQELTDGTTLVYAQGKQELLLSMSNGNDSLHSALSHQINVANSEMFASAEGAVAVPATAGISTAALVVGGIVFVGAGIAISNHSSGGSSSSSSSSSSDSEESTSSTSTGYFVDSAVSGATYTRFIDANNNGTLDEGEQTGTGTTGADGSFQYEAGETITFEIAGVTLGTMDASDINTDGQVFPQDILGVDRGDVTNASVTAMGQLLQTLDSDGDASNGITVETNEDGDIVTDSGNVIVDSNDFENNITNVLADVDTSVKYESGANVAVVTESDAQAHILGTVTGVDDISEITASDLTELVALIDGGATSIIVDGSIDLTGTSYELSESQLASVNGYTGSITVNDLDATKETDFYITLSQYNQMTLSSSSDDDIKIIITDEDAVADTHNSTEGALVVELNDLDLSDAKTIILKTEATTITTEVSAAQAPLVVTSTMGNTSTYYVSDSLSNLTLTNPITDLGSPTMVMLKLTEDTDLSSISINTQVTDINGEGYSVILNNTQYDQVVTNENGIFDTSSITVKDSIESTTNNAYDVSNVIVTDESSISELNAITNTGTVTPMIVEDTFINLTNEVNASWFTTNPDITITSDVTTGNMYDDILGLDGSTPLTTGDVTYTLADTLEILSIAGHADIVANAEAYVLIDNAGELIITTLAEATIIDGAINAADYTYTIALSLSELVAADTVPDTYTLSDAAGDISTLTVEEALILDGATNKGDYTYTISDTVENVFEASTEVNALLVAVTLTDSEIDANDLYDIDGFINAQITIEATSIVGWESNIYDIFESTGVETPEDITVTITDGTSEVLLATELLSITTGTTGTVTIENAVTISGTRADVSTAVEGITIQPNINMTFTDTGLTVEQLNETDGFITGVITATVAFTDVATALTITNTNGNNEYTIDLGIVSVTTEDFDSLNALYSTINGTISITATDEQDFSGYDLTGVDTINVDGDTIDYIEVTPAQAALLANTASNSGTFEYGLHVDSDFDLDTYLDLNHVGTLRDITSNDNTAQTITIDANDIAGDKLSIIGDSSDTVIFDSSLVQVTNPDLTDEEPSTAYTDGNKTIYVSTTVTDIVISGSLEDISALSELPFSYELTDLTSSDFTNIAVGDLAIIAGANNASDYEGQGYSLSDTAENLLAEDTANGHDADSVLGDATTSITVTDATNLSIAELAQLEALPNVSISTYSIEDTAANLFDNTAASLVQDFGNADLSLGGSITLQIGGTNALTDEVITFTDSADLITKLEALEGIESTTFGTDADANKLTILSVDAGAGETLNISAVADLKATEAATETSTVTFQDLIAGQSVTVAGVTLTATGAITADEVALAFSSAATSPTNGDITGTLADWTVSTATSAVVTYTSTTADSNETDIVTSEAGTAGSAEVQVITIANATLAEGSIYTLTVGADTLTTAALGTTPDMDALVAALQGATDYASKDYTVANDGSGNLEITWKTTGDIAEVAALTATSITTTSADSDDSPTDGTDATAEVQIIDFTGMTQTDGNITIGGVTIAVLAADDVLITAGKIQAALDGQTLTGTSNAVAATVSSNIVTLTFAAADDDVALVTLADDTSAMTNAPTPSEDTPYEAAIAEVQTITPSNAALVADSIYTLTLGADTLTTAALGTTPDMDALVAALQGATDYASKDYTVANDGSGNLEITWKTTGDIAEVAALTATSNSTSTPDTAVATDGVADIAAPTAVDVTTVDGSAAENSTATAVNSEEEGTTTVNTAIDTDIAVTVSDAATVTQVDVLNTATSGEVNVLTLVTDGDITGLATSIGDLAGITGLTTIDAATDGASTAMTLTAADLFAANDATGDLTLTITGGTANAEADTLDLSSGAETWATTDNGETYTTIGNFDGVAGDETYTINVTNVAVEVAVV